ncbi:cytochrome P450 [Streptomyces sp. JHA26]|uniref:cytochrome P450 n=1 Tax=Streptomyces sp. JHA26 TaxID=1917143 RepID=UPI00098AC5B5|nr:cytochrome P450 [Streptomyces sp. JHA26]
MKDAVSLDFPLTARTCPFDPPERYAELRATVPVSRVALPSGQTAWLLTRHADVRAVLDDPRFSSDMSRPGFPHLYPKPVEPVLKGTFIRMDGEEHAHYRRMLTGLFSVKRVEAMRPFVEQVVEDCLDRMAAHGAPADLVRELAYPVPSRVICGLLGVPHEDHATFGGYLNTLFDGSSDQEQFAAAKAGLSTYLDALVSKKEKEPEDDLISVLVEQQYKPGRLSRQELVTISWMLLAAGHETTAHMIGLGALTLMEHPDQLARATRGPAAMADAVEELLRHQTVMQLGMTRVAVADAEIGGTLIRAGEGVIALLSLANRDPDVFPDPDTVDVTRGARHHVAFGFGPHQCLGHSLARLELAVVFDRLFRRFPKIRPTTPTADIRFRQDAIVYGVAELPVEW